MKKAIFLVFSVLLLAGGSAGSAQALEEGVFVSGKEWIRQMSPKEKLMSLLPPMALYHKFGIRFQRSVFEYIETLDSELAGNPVLANEDVANIFASTVYHLEPENRLPLERMGAVFEIMQKREAENLYPSIPLSDETVLTE